MKKVRFEIKLSTYRDGRTLARIYDDYWDSMDIDPPTREYYGGIERAYHELGLTEEIAGVLEPALARARHRAKMRRGTRSGK